MEIALSDLLTCPRCGPMHGLILLPEEVRDRRVLSGVLGCANCRERYRVEGGVADLRGSAAGVPRGGAADADVGGDAGPDPGRGQEREPDREPDREAALRLAALLGLTEAGGVVLVSGPAALHAGLLPELVTGTRVVVEEDPGLGAAPGAEAGDAGAGPAVSRLRLRLGGRLPMRTGSLRGVALTGDRARGGEIVEEWIRVLGPAGRLVLDPAPADARRLVEEAGHRVLVEEDGVLVAEIGARGGGR